MPTQMPALPIARCHPHTPRPSLRDPDIHVRIAATADDYEVAFRLAYDVYYPLGYTAHHPDGWRVSSYQLRPSAFVLIAYRDSEPVGTLTLYADDPEGLPGDEGWRDDLDGLRAGGHRLFECGTLVVPPGGDEAGMPLICFAMFRYALALGLRTPQACFCSFVQRRHVPFYQQALCHRRFGQARHYAWNGLDIPDVTPLLLHLPEAEGEFRARYGAFFDRECEQISARIDADLRRRQALDFAGLRLRFPQSPLMRLAEDALC